MKRPGEQGFSLLELTIAMLLTIGLMGAIFSLVGQQQQVFLSESGTTDMNENMRVAVDMLTRDIQSAGMGLPRTNGSFAAIYYKDGASGAADSILIINGDAWAPDADVTSYTAGTGTFVFPKPAEVATGLTYGANGVTTNIYRAYATSSKRYLWYDDKLAKVCKLTADATYSGGNVTMIVDTSAANFWSPANTFGSAIDTGQPAVAGSKICMLNNLVAYRVNTTTKELERTEDLTNWYAVARGITDLQLQYFTIATTSPPDPGTYADAPSDRRIIRAVRVNIRAETADLPNASKNYRRAVQQFEVTPRNFNLWNNTSLSSNTAATWDF